jgi:hypothetical protein
MKMKNMINKIIAFVCVMVLPAISFCQPPGPGDENPDVPFDDNMNLVFLFIGITFAAVIVWQEMSRRRKLQGTDVK